jgi:hypothetical protein
MKNLLLILLVTFGNSIYAQMGIDASLLGDGYDQTRQKVMTKCVEGELAYTGRKTISAKFERIRSERRLRTALRLEAGAEVSLEAITAEGAVDFYSDAVSTEYKESFVYMFGMSGVIARLTNHRFRQGVEIPVGVNAKDICGDYFVNGIELGASLLVNVSFVFEDKDLKTEFDAEVEVDLIDIIQGYGKGEVDFEKYKNKVKIKVAALQIGGKRTVLKTLFSHSEGSRPFTECDISNADACNTVIENIVEYASGPFSDEMSNMLYNPNGENSAAHLRILTSSYLDFGITEVAQSRPELINRYLQDNRNDLKVKYLRYRRDLESVSGILQSRVRPIERERFRKLEEKLKSNIESVVKVIISCHDRPSACIQEIGRLELEDYSSSELSYQYSFWDYCNRSNLSEGQTRFVSKFADFFGLNEQNTTCDEIELKIQSARSLDLSKSGLTDVSFLRFAKNLEYLKLRENSISDVDFLLDLNKLRVLDLSLNKIAELPLELSFERLAYINLSGNLLRDIYPLESTIKLGTFRFFAVADNPFVDPYFLEDMATYLPEKYEASFLSLDDVCEKWRLVALDVGKIDQRHYENLVESDFVPLFYNWEKPSWGDLEHFGNCKSEKFRLLRLLPDRI